MILAIDASAVTASAALGDRDGIVRSEFVNAGLTHSETLLPMIRRVMGDTPFDALDAIAVTAGPGSFTGVRIGIATVKGLAFAADIPCVPVSTLEAIACNYYGEKTVVCAVMDARRMQFYNALFALDGDRMTRLTPDRAISIEALREELRAYDSVVIAGDGACLCAESIGLDNCTLAEESRRYQNAAAFLPLAEQKETIAAAELVPTYLRPSQAERELKRKKEKQP